MGWITDLLKEIPSAARFKSELEASEAERIKLRDENASLRSQLGDLTTRLADAQREIEQIRAAAQPQPNANRHKPEHDVLLLLMSNDGLTAGQVAGHLGIGEQAALHHLTRLMQAKLHLVRTTGGGDDDLLWSLHDGGRAYLAERGLLP